MANNVNMTVDFAGVRLANCVMTASGTCGYGDELADFFDPARLGGFITKSITLAPRAGNPTPRAVETSAGMLNAIGLANIGLERFIEEKIPILRDLGTAIFVNVAGQTIDEYVAIADRLSSQDAIAGLELNISCPNVKKGGITFGTDPPQIREITAAVKQAAGRKCLMVKLTPCVTDITVTAQAAVDGGADALSLVNTFTAMSIDIYRRKPVLANRTGGLSGPAIKPIAVYLVNRVYEHVARAAGVPVLGLGGIRTASDALEFIIAGASAVAIGTGTFMNPACAVEIVDGIRDYCRTQGISNITDLVGTLK
ncbi:MAG TPA: dihydroorotate dehydrogenase [Anaerohalosphaeraceae bacterium]|jgi:dihydroorotate dehydrogenase (NAD+) catalytic subunit|nr:dihydroorotate dehydrogenase [Anaerohalosphaeraceae bacterium]HRT50841.1 dihydroorotate dehydrogenase [Anaerohalosphaeraceae bacterium]HRT86721.1 dihydroorotate dehydrogenase [Anaerohalosphaeraceae bacterium]